MSKGYSNILAMNHVANKTFILDVGYNTKTMFCKITNDRDCLPADITNFREAEFKNKDDLMVKVHQIEKLGYEVCVDTGTIFYETKGD